ncbi:MAG: hypothetical protein QOE51_163, partial [Actinoplanes sp.]|nr:hypothetical protein [Actinoplanes sp.]
LVVALSRVVPGSARPPEARAGEPERHSGGDSDLTVAAPLRPGLRLVPRGPMPAGHDEDRRAA